MNTIIEIYVFIYTNLFNKCKHIYIYKLFYSIYSIPADSSSIPAGIQ